MVGGHSWGDSILMTNVDRSSGGATTIKQIVQWFANGNHDERNAALNSLPDQYRSMTSDDISFVRSQHI